MDRGVHWTAERSACSRIEAPPPSEAPAGPLPSNPRVSVGMPIYNGASTLKEALESLVYQTEADIEIVISDNASTDDTARICREFAERDPRIRYFRHPKIVPVTENFNFVLKQARAPYFMWAAHDDVRSRDFIAQLAAALDRNEHGILAFGDVVELLNGRSRHLDLRFANGGLSAYARLRNAAMFQLHHLYGVWRTDKLRSIRWRHNDWWHDTPPIMAATMLGEFIHIPGVALHYRSNPHPFFSWTRRSGISGALHGAGQLARRSGDLARLVWLSAVAVTEVAGLPYGILAGWMAARKVASQIGGYIWRSQQRQEAPGMPRIRHWTP